MGRCTLFMTEQIIQVERMEEAVSLFGSYDSNIRLLEQEYDVKVLIRDTQIKVSGEQPGVMTAVKAINGLLHLINSGEQLTEQNVRYVMTLVREGAEDTVRQLGGDSLCVTTKGKIFHAEIGKVRPQIRCNRQRIVMSF